MKYIVVSGCLGGLGKAVVDKLLDNNYKVIGIDIVPYQSENINFTYFKCDLTNPKEREKICSKIKKITNNIYAIVNLVGIFKLQSLIEGSSEDLEKIINVNFFGIYYLNKSLFNLLNKNSKIINMSSEIARYSPQPFMGYYAISKKMVDSYSDVLRRECNYLGIKVIKIQAGSFKTNMHKDATNDYDVLLANTKKFKSPLTKLKKMMTNELKKSNNPEIFANLVLKIINKKKCKIIYKIKNSFALSFLDKLPEKLQDKIYTLVIK